MDDWQFSDEARDAGRDVPGLDEKALVIEGRVHLGIGDEPSWSAPVDFHEECGFAWSIHDSRMVRPFGGWKAPFGCPPNETAAREAWGR